MHAAIELATREARARKAEGIKRLALKIGAVAGVDTEALRFAFDVAAAGTLAAGAVLEIVEIPAKAHCNKCAADFTIERGPLFACPLCGEFSGDLRQGRELELAQIELILPCASNAAAEKLTAIK